MCLTLQLLEINIFYQLATWPVVLTHIMYVAIRGYVANSNPSIADIQQWTIPTTTYYSVQVLEKTLTSAENN